MDIKVNITNLTINYPTNEEEKEIILNFEPINISITDILKVLPLEALKYLGEEIIKEINQRGK
jgi:hypothetical protein